MGCLWAAKLTQSGAEVTLLLRNKDSARDWDAQGGLSLWEGELRQTIPVAARIAGEATAPIRNLLLCTKAQDTLAALRSVEHLLEGASRIVLLQNGIAAQQEVLEAYPQQGIFCLSTSHGAYVIRPFEVVHAGRGEAWLGAISPAALREEPSSVLALLPARSMNIQWDTDITSRLWQKFAVNCAINALTVIHDCANGELLTRAAARIELIPLCHEIEGLLRDIPRAPTLPPLYPQVTRVLEATAQNISSTLQDVRLRRSTEMDYLNGYLSGLAQAAGLPQPLNQALLRRFQAAVQDRSD